MRQCASHFETQVQENFRMRSLVHSIAAATLLLVAPVQAETIELNNGDSVTGEVVETTDEAVVIEHDTLGRITVPKSDIKPEDVEEVIPGLFGTSILEGWQKGLGIGLSGSQGQTEDINLRVNARLLSDTDRFRHKLLATYLYRESEGDNTDNEASLDGEESFKFEDSAFFLMATGRYDYDEFEAWDHRVALSVGPGYQFFDTERFKLRSSIGAGVAHTWEGENSTEPEGLMRVEASYDWQNGVTFGTEHTWYPSLEDFPDSRVISSADIVTDIGDEGGFVMSFGVDNEYDSQAIGNNYDFKYHALIGHQF
jgi:hypothetical protein